MHDDHDSVGSVELLRARRLKTTIEQFWRREHGLEIEIKCESFRARYCSRSEHVWNAYKLVSNTVNGWPVEAAAARKRA